MTGSHRGPGLWARLRRRYEARLPDPGMRRWDRFGERWEAARTRDWREELKWRRRDDPEKLED